MADQTLDVKTDRFNSLIVAPNAWLLYLPSVAYLNKGDTLTVREVDNLGNYLGRYRTGLCNKISTEQFIVYPSGTKCYYFTPLSMAVQVFQAPIIKTTVTVSHTGDLLQTILFSQKIAAGTMGINDILRFQARLFGTFVAGTYTFKLYFNTSAVIAGATLWAQAGFGATITNEDTFVRSLVFKAAVNAQEAVISTANLANDELAAVGTANTAYAIDFAVDQYFIITSTSTNNGNVAGLRSLYAQIIR
jgi:hypothetical protein